MSYDINKSYGDENSQFTPIKPGWKVVQINRAILGESGSGKPMLSFQYKVLIGDDRGKALRDYFLLVDEWYGYGKLGKMALAVDPNMAGSSSSKAGFEPHEQASVFQHLLGGILNVKVFHKKDTEDTDKVYANVDTKSKNNGYGYVTPSRRSQVFAEIGGEPAIEDDWYTDFDGMLIDHKFSPTNNTSNGGEQDNSDDESDVWDDPMSAEIPF